MMQRTNGTYKTFAAGAAITANSFCKFGADDDTLLLAAAATDVIVAVSKEAVASGARGDFQMDGIAEVKLGNTVVRGDNLTSDSAGLAIPLVAAATIKSSFGIAMASGVVTDIIPFRIAPFTAVTA